MFGNYERFNVNVSTVIIVVSTVITVSTVVSIVSTIITDVSTSGSGPSSYRSSGS